MKLNFFKTLNILTLICAVLAVSCADDFPYRNDPIPEGDGTLSATVTFTPTAASNLGATRTVGNAIQNIESLCVLVYDINKNLVKKYSESELSNYVVKKYNEKDAYQVDQSKDFPDEEGAHTDETSSAQATFGLSGLPYGRYYIYAVANMGDLSAYESEIETVEGLQNIKLIWDTKNIENNNQMFGYFTSANNMDSKGFDPERPLTFTNKESDSKIHAWLKRAASKVTVAFDPSGLNQGVTIYIRNVTVRDIPKTCLLGAENTPALTEGETADDILWNHLSSYSDPDYKNPAPAVENSRLEYDSKGVITTGESTGDGKTDGLRLDNSIRSSVPANAHAVNAPSLFFYENNQNVWLEKQPDFKVENDKKNDRYNKQPQRDGDDKIGTTIHDPENDKDFKDRVPLGTYVEVEAYYISSNPANPGEGTIKYRFMLGKDTSFDYDAQRNYHYKLTLGFNGWANDPDWHIDYVITTPDIEVPSVFRVSYLYQQKSELPIKIVGDIEYLTVLITENNWAPYDPDSISNQTITLGGKSYKVPRGVVPTSPSTYQFQWNQTAFSNNEYRNPARSGTQYPDTLTPGQQRPQFGFLALHLPSRDVTTIKTGFSAGSNTSLINYWKNNLEGERRFSGVQGNDDFKIGHHDYSWGDTKDGKKYSEDDGYTVNEIFNDNGVALEKQRILMLPLWTRTKTLIEGSGFSGNNPYEAFERKATVQIIGSFKVGDETQRIVKEVEVYQVKRITNPKGVWRAHDRNETFNVTLLEPENSNAESNFQPFISQGEWTAFIDQQTIVEGNLANTFSIRPNGETNGFMRNDTIHGNTGSTINFAITFNGTVEENESHCAVIKVLYHGNQCMHKILVRKGYNSPLRMGGTKDDNSDGKLWSSFSLYQATRTGGTAGVNETFDVVLTKNPLMLGSMFRRGRQNQGIFVWNNQQDNLGPFAPPGTIPFVVGEKVETTSQNWVDQWRRLDWVNIGFRDDRETTNNLGTFYALDDNGNYSTDDNGNPLRYRVPTYAEFQALTDNSEFGFGVFYGSSATSPKLNAIEAYGLIDPFNQGLFESKNGMRAVVAYDKKTGNQILFPMGRFGTGRRNNFIITGANAGELRYGDVNYLLTITRSANNLYRPIPYNTMTNSGNIYWIDQYVDATNTTTGQPCLGWDMNYFNFDFNPYTANNYRDACPIKLVIDED
ncbi:MAG: hypothetical protein K2L45_11890 [Muribaculaceae bacterium]|nr:hypothetical protein [Muribaculaceae bacterium]